MTKQQKRSNAAKSVRNYRKQSCFGVLDSRKREYGVLAERSHFVARQGVRRMSYW